MLAWALTSPEFYFGAALVFFLALLIASMALNRRSDARRESLCGSMKDFPKEGTKGSDRPRLGSAAKTEDEPAPPLPRNIDF